MLKSITNQNHKNKLLAYQEIRHLTKRALKIIKIEINTYPCFGLVSKQDNGCHNDMNFKLFCHSQKTFRYYFNDIITLIKKHKELNFDQLRQLGLIQERRMFRTTNNVNTHKGLIFHYGIIFYLTMHANYYQIRINDWTKWIKNFTYPLEQDFKNFNNLTSGEKLFNQYQVTGARGIALSGYEIIFNKALPFLNQYINQYPKLTLENQCLLLIVFYLARIDDTTVINKIGYHCYQKIKKQAQVWLNILNRQNWESFYFLINSYNNEYKLNNISPGGCADLAVITLYLHHFMKKRSERSVAHD